MPGISWNKKEAREAGVEFAKQSVLGNVAKGVMANRSLRALKATKTFIFTQRCDVI